MKVKTNIRAGSGGDSGAGKNSKGGQQNDDPVPPYVPPVTRCAGV